MINTQELSEKYKNLEERLNKLKTDAMVEKQSLEQKLAERAKLEEQCKRLCGISLTEVDDKMIDLQNKITTLDSEITSEVETIERQFNDFKK